MVAEAGAKNQELLVAKTYHQPMKSRLDELENAQKEFFTSLK